MVDIIKQDMANIWASSGDKTAPDSAKIATGWVVEAVPRQWWNWFENRQDTNIAYMLQKGIPEWDAFTEYQTNKSYVQRNNVVYKAKLTGINQDPATATTYWGKAFPESSASLEALRALTPATDRAPYFTNGTTAALMTVTAFARTILDDTTNTAVRTTIGAQASHANLTALSGATAETNTFPYWNSATTMLASPITAFGRSLIDDADAPAARTTLGLGTAALSDVTTSATDTTVGRLMKTGDFGSGVETGLTADPDLAVVGGFYRYTSSTINTPIAGQSGTILVLPYSTTYTGQLALHLGQATQNPKIFYRARVNSVWGNWDEYPTVAAVLSTIQSFGIGVSTGNLTPNLDTVTVTSSGRFDSSSTGIPMAGIGGSVFTQIHSATYRTQTAISLAGTNSSVYNRMFTRTYNSGTWGTWKGYVDTTALATALDSYALNGANTDITSLSNVLLSGTSLIGTSLRSHASDSTLVPGSGGNLITPSIRLSDVAAGAKSLLAIQGYQFSSGHFGSTIVGTRSQGNIGVHGTVPIGRSVFTLLGAASDGTQYNPIARIDYYTTQNQTATASGGEVRVLTTPNDTIVPTLAATFHHNGDFTAVGTVRCPQIQGMTTPLSIAQGGTGSVSATGTGQNVLQTSPALTGVPTAPTASVGTSTTQLATTEFVIANTANGAFGGAKNRIINGAAQIVQRGSAAFTAGVTGYGGPDRFRASNSSTGGQFTQEAATMTHESIVKFTVRQTVNTALPTAASGNFWLGLNQLIEGRNSYDLPGKQITASFVFNTNVSGTYPVSLRDSTGVISHLSKFTAVANTPIKVIVTTTVPTNAVMPNSGAVGLSITIGAINTGTLQTPTTGSWVSGNFITTTGTTNWGLVAGNFIELTDLQIEVGDVATPFERKSISEVTAQCQRYFEALDCIMIGNGTTGNNFGGVFEFKVAKRATPSLFLFQDGVRVGNVNVGTLTASANAESILVFRAIPTTTGCQFHERYHAEAEL